MQSAMHDDRRMHPRKVVDLEVRLSCLGDSDARHTFSVHDISLCGMSVSSATITPRPGDTLCLCLAERVDSCSKEHVIEATVIHERNGVVGLQFDLVGVYILRDIQRLLRGGRIF